MPDDTDNHTIRLLQELREMRTEMREGFDEIDQRLSGMTYFMSMMAGSIADHGDRIDTLEDAVTVLQKSQPQT